MKDHLSETDLIAIIPGLTRPRLVSFIEAEVVIPLRTTEGPAFRQIDLARIRLLCELSDDLDLDTTALGIIMTLLDQLHSTRTTLRQIATALEAEPLDVRARVGAAARRG